MHHERRQLRRHNATAFSSPSQSSSSTPLLALAIPAFFLRLSRKPSFSASSAKFSATFLPVYCVVALVSTALLPAVQSNNDVDPLHSLNIPDDHLPFYILSAPQPPMMVAGVTRATALIPKRDISHQYTAKGILDHGRIRKRINSGNSLNMQVTR